MDNNIQKALWLGVSVLMFLAVVAIGMSMFQAGNTIAKEGQKEINDMAASISQTEYAAFDNSKVSGNDVISALNKYKHQSGEMQIIVQNKTGSTMTYISSGSAQSGSLGKINLSAINTSIQNSQSKSSTGTYINPFGDFYATLIYDANEQVRGINFVQQ